MATASDRTPRLIADIAAYDRDGGLVLIVEAKANRLGEDAADETLRGLADRVRSLTFGGHDDAIKAGRQAIAANILGDVMRATRGAVDDNVPETVSRSVEAATRNALRVEGRGNHALQKDSRRAGVGRGRPIDVRPISDAGCIERFGLGPRIPIEDPRPS